MSFLIFSLVCLQTGSAFPMALSHKDFLEKHYLNLEQLRNPQGFMKSKDPDWPDYYIEPTVKQSLNLVIPQYIKQGLNVDAGYNKFVGRPTLKLDYFLPFKQWSDKSFFITPRMVLSERESYSLGMGFRHVINHDLMVGFHCFHDWVRPGRADSVYLKEAGVGMEISALPGMHSDLTVALNAYLPLNEKQSLANEGMSLVRESMPFGYDAKVGFLFPAMSDWFDIRLDAAINSYRGEKMNQAGYRNSISFKTRNGLFDASLERSSDSRFGESYRVEANVKLTFDWMNLLNGKNPFSAPYQISSKRYDRKIRQSLYSKVTRKYDLPVDKAEIRATLTAGVSRDSVQLSGGFPLLPNAQIIAQVSQSPWEDWCELTTNSSGAYSAQLNLPPGTYRIRMIHKPTGRISNAQTVVVSNDISTSTME